MENNDKAIIEEETPKKAIPLKLLTGGKDTDDPNWLKALPDRSVFLTRPKYVQPGMSNLTEGLAMLEIVARTEKSARLFDSINRNEFMVDMARFSSRMEKFEVLGQIKDQEDGE